MYYHLDIEQQLNRILKKINHSELMSSKTSTPNQLYDICDGRYYKSLLETEDGDLFKRKEALTFLINTDGASICKSSKLTIWPVYLVCNEIPLESRFSLENVILAGMIAF